MATKALIPLSNRTRRIGLFCDQIILLMVQECMRSDLPWHCVSKFCDRIFHDLIDCDDEFTVVDLVAMIEAEGMMERIMAEYRATL